RGARRLSRGHGAQYQPARDRSRPREGRARTTLARRAYIGSLTRALDPNGREYFWIGGGESKWWGRGDLDTDYDAVRGGYISITPLHLDLTNYDLLKEISDWQLTL